MPPRVWNKRPFSNKKLEELPDDCLLTIFEFLPLKHAFSIRAVNSNWNKLILRMCRGRKNLFLFGSFRALADYSKRMIRFGENDQWDVSSSAIGQYSLIITRNSLSESVLEQLLAFFPNIQKLVFFYFNWPGEEKLQMLLGQYGNKLISLTIRGMPMMEDGQQNRIWTTITEFPKLTRFHMFATNRVVFQVDQIAPLIARLEHFTLVDYLHGDSSLLLAQLGPRLKAFILDNVQLSKEQLETVIQQAPHLKQSVRSLFIGNVSHPNGHRLPVNPVLPLNDQQRVVNHNEVVVQVQELFFRAQAANQMLQAINRRRGVEATNSEKILEFICNHFEQLKHIDVAFMINGRKLTIQQITDQYAKLKKLQSTHLIMTMESKNVTENSLKPLHSVRHLKLDLNPPAKKNFEMIMPLIFEAVKHIKVESSDQGTLDSLKKFFFTTKSLKNVNYIKLSKGPNFRQFFADIGYSEQYLAYLHENIGPLVDLL